MLGITLALTLIAVHTKVNLTTYFTPILDKSCVFSIYRESLELIPKNNQKKVTQYLIILINKSLRK